MDKAGDRVTDAADEMQEWLRARSSRGTAAWTLRWPARARAAVAPGTGP